MNHPEERNIAATTGGAVGLGALASFIGLCCMGPWAVALFGVPGAVYLARWAPARPYILVIAAALLAWAFWRVYGHGRNCAESSCKKAPSMGLKVFLWLGAILLALAFFADQLQWLLVDPAPEGIRE